MSATYGRTSPRQFAFYDHDSSCWRTWPAISLWGSEPFSGTWPRSGTTRDGAAFELPTSAPRTAATGCSSSPLLPTPAAQEPGGTVEQYHDRLRKADGREPTFTPLSMLVQTLLPTPTVNDSRGGRNMTSGRSDPDSKHHDGMTLTDWCRLLPTPTARDWKDGPPCEAVEENALLGRVVWRLLPTPASADAIRGPDYARMNRGASGGDDLATAVTRHIKDRPRSRGVPTPPPSPDGSTSSDDPPPPPPTTEDG